METKKLKLIWNQVPEDYYEKGWTTNFLQKIWHGNKWRVLQRLLEQNEKKILDVGCASGHITERLRTYLPSASITGIDVSDKFIHFAKKNYSNVKFVIADAHKLPFGNNSFDTIICTEMLEHVVDPGKVMSEIKRCLKQNGKILISMDSGSLLFALAWYLWIRYGRGRVWRGSHLHTFTSRKLKHLIETSGFAIIKEKKGMLGMAVYFKAIKA